MFARRSGAGVEHDPERRLRRSRPSEDPNLLDRIGLHPLDPQTKRPAEADIVVALLRELPRERLELDASVPILTTRHAGRSRASSAR